MEKRDHYIDNAKFILIFLVVLAHGISDAQRLHPVVSAAWSFINLFHMPAFLFISGYFAKSAVSGGKVDLQKPFTYTLYYLVAQVAAVLYDHYVTHYPYTYKSVFYSASSLWFLQIVIIYFLMLPFFARLKKNVVIILSFAAGLLIGFDENVGHFLSIHRAFVFLPFFIAGFYFTPELFRKLKDAAAKWRICGGALLAGIFALIYFGVLNIPNTVYTGQFNYYNIADSCATPWYLCWLWRIAAYITGGAMIAAFMLIIPRSRTFFSRFGSRTISVYILHRFLYLASSEFDWVRNYVNNKWSFALLVMIIIVVIFILSLKPFYIPFRALGKIKIDRFMKNTE